MGFTMIKPILTERSIPKPKQKYRLGKKSHIKQSRHLNKSKLSVADLPSGFAILNEVIKPIKLKDKVSKSSFDIKEWDAPVSKRTRIG